MTRDLVGVVMALMIAAVLVVPLAIFGSEHFGRPLFNYTRYWMWMDDFMTEASPFQDKYRAGSSSNSFRMTKRPQSHGISSGTGSVMPPASVHRHPGSFGAFLFTEAKIPLRGIFWRPAEKRWEQPLTHRGIYLFLLGILCVLLMALGRARLSTA